MGVSLRGSTSRLKLKLQGLNIGPIRFSMLAVSHRLRNDTTSALKSVKSETRGRHMIQHDRRSIYKALLGVAGGLGFFLVIMHHATQYFRWAFCSLSIQAHVSKIRTTPLVDYLSMAAVPQLVSWRMTVAAVA